MQANLKYTNAREAYRPALSSPSEVITMFNRTEKRENKEQGKTQHKTPRGKKHKGTHNKNHTSSIALERSVA